ncbi:hypothetical protein [Ferroplasma sp.]|jgi:hypothetical protein|uniref:hypothetical protein n=1 Tax=Ferroplasma sp. TaxID=2591003 RepID=UPI0017C296A4|nr:hypothetical protein [Ferroplasma sp.]HII82534.1 hypothetical protein [Ferroplasma sp.]
MNLKSHYKIIISIIIVIILLSSFTVYYNDAISNPRTYYSPTDYQYNLKYFDDGNAFPINANRTFSHEITSFGIYNNMEVNLTSKVISPDACIHVFSGGQFFACLGVDVTGHIPGITSINVSALQYNNKVPCIQIDNVTGRENPAIVKNASMEYYYCITSNELDHNLIHNKYYNIVITVSIDKYIYDRFYIDAEKESAVYGCVLKNDEPVNNYSSTMYVENMNNSIINTINIKDGYYYYFVQPDTEYKLYSLNSTNNTLKLIDTISNKNITPGNSCEYNIRL